MSIVACGLSVDCYIMTVYIIHCVLDCVFMDELLTKSQLGVTINIYCGALMYADDIALMANSPEILQAMLDIIHLYAHK